MATIYKKYYKLLSREIDYSITLDEIDILLEQADMYPDYHWLMAIHYLDYEKYEEFLFHIFKSFLLGSKIGFNTYGYYLKNIEKNKEEAIKNYKKAIFYNNSSTSMWNLFLSYEDEETKNFYLDEAINNGSGEACYAKALLFEKSDINHLNYLKKGAKFGNYDCLKNLLPYYKINKYQKYKKYLEILAEYNDKNAITQLYYVNLTDKEKMIDSEKHICENICFDDYLKENIETDFLEKIGFATVYLQNKKDTKQVMTFADELIKINNEYGYILRAAYYYYIGNKKNLMFKNLRIAENINKNAAYLHITLCFYYEKFENNYDKSLEYLIKSYEVRKNYVIVEHIMKRCKTKNNYDTFIKYLKEYITNYYDIDVNEHVPWIIKQNHVKFAIDLIECNLTIGLINLVKYFSEYKEMCSYIKSKIIIKKTYECKICCENKDIHTILPCLSHNVCLDCFKQIKKECPFCKFDLYDTSRQIFI